MKQESRRQRASRLLRISWSVVREDRRLLVFPAVSAAVSLLVGAGSFGVAHLVAGERWAEQTLGTAGIGAAFGFAMVPALALLMAGAFTSGAAGPILFALGGGLLCTLLAVQTAMDQVFRVFVYRSALGLDGGEGPFTAADLGQPFGPSRG